MILRQDELFSISVPKRNLLDDVREPWINFVIYVVVEFIVLTITASDDSVFSRELMGNPLIYGSNDS